MSATNVDRKAGGESGNSSSHVRFENVKPEEEEDEEARLRRGSVPKDLKDIIAIRGILGRNAVSQGYSTNRSFLRSRSEASIFRPEPDSITENESENPSTTLWDSGYTTLNRTKSTSSVISGLNDDVLRAGWRRNEPGPMWEQCHELEPDRRAIVKIDEDEGDGFEVEEMEMEDAPTDSSAVRSSDLADLMKDEGESESTLQETDDRVGEMNLKTSSAITTLRRGLGKTQSMPVGGSFGTRPEQPKFYREYDDTFMRMDMDF
ncbi:hypothetical protein BY996DRAFT_4585050 [Phakopsora pachyrhizi]|uniref:Uncharacterized protein n=1 Tax=Phakopsora pachyrhizi TaxID=170000 RepID=A0AAV0AXV3_PHAPC|nr:hypothetical protein BY996DRAFT_4585050 [Phakopsora pachyrhizi]CAH7675198.1 hypothetical protein PPACK8108_LOCUS10173 [Phakopsora pachyrhizi]